MPSQVTGVSSTVSQTTPLPLPVVGPLSTCVLPHDAGQIKRKVAGHGQTPGQTGSSEATRTSTMEERAAKCYGPELLRAL